MSSRWPRRNVLCPLGALALALAGVLAKPEPARAGSEWVDVELVLAVDVSWSMDLDEQRLQREGYVAAFNDPDVIAAIEGGLHGRIAVTYFEWAGTGLQSVVAPWTLIEDAGDARAFSEALAGAYPARMRRTSISGAIATGTAMFEGNGYRGLRKVIDISGDGPNNMGEPVLVARDAAVSRGVVINGLPLILKEPNPVYGIHDLDIYYEDCVIGGPGAFIVTVREPGEFIPAIRRKLILEIAGRPSPGAAPKPLRAQYVPGAGGARADCLIGEKLWRRQQIP